MLYFAVLEQLTIVGTFCNNFAWQLCFSITRGGVSTISLSTSKPVVPCFKKMQFRLSWYKNLPARRVSSAAYLPFYVLSWGHHNSYQADPWIGRHAFQIKGRCASSPRKVRRSSNDIVFASVLPRFLLIQGAEKYHHPMQSSRTSSRLRRAAFRVHKLYCMTSFSHSSRQKDQHTKECQLLVRSCHTESTTNEHVADRQVFEQYRSHLIKQQRAQVTCVVLKK